jgi:hypothetical protein
VRSFFKARFTTSDVDQVEHEPRFGEGLFELKRNDYVIKNSDDEFLVAGEGEIHYIQITVRDGSNVVVSLSWRTWSSLGVLQRRDRRLSLRLRGR